MDNLNPPNVIHPDSVALPAPLWLPLPPRKVEVDSSTYFRHKGGLRLISNFKFEVTAHSMLPDKSGSKLYLLDCVTEGANRFRVPLCYDEMDSLAKVTQKMNRFKAGNNAVLHQEAAKVAKLHTILKWVHKPILDTFGLLMTHDMID